MIPSASVLYLLSLMGTAVLLMLAGWATFSHRRAARRYSAYMKQMPKAVEYDDLDTLVRDRREELDYLIREAAGTAELVERKGVAEKWLNEHEARLTRMLVEREECQRLSEQLQELKGQNEEQRTLYGKYKLSVDFLEGKIKQLETAEQDSQQRLTAAKELETHAQQQAEAAERDASVAQRRLAAR